MSAGAAGGPARTGLSLLLVALAAVLAVGCGGPSTDRASGAVREVGRLTPLTPDQPVLVFVYTDG